MKSQHHSFDIDLAAKYGVDGAIMIHHFQHWISVNLRLKRGKKQGHTWTYQSHQEIAAHFPYYTPKQVRRIIDNLVDEGVILKGNFNKQGYDRTSWYAFSDESYFLTPRLICPNGQMDLPESANGNAQMGTPIPDTKTNTGTDAEKVNDPLPPKPEPAKLPHTVPEPVIESLTFQTQAAGHCFSPSVDDALGMAAKFKLDPDQTETLVWLSQQNINTDLQTLSWWARTESLKNLQNWHKTALNRKAKDIGAYMAKLVQKKAIVVSDETKEMAKFITEYLECNGVTGFKIVDKYAVLYYPDGNECEIPLYMSAESIRMKLDNYLDHCENHKRT